LFRKCDFFRNQHKEKRPTRQEILDFEEKLAAEVFESLKNSFPNIKIPD